jgi:hypothetical protein
MARVTVETSTGDLSNGEAFHIGDGWFVTAAHVLEDNKLVEVVGHFRSAHPGAAYHEVTRPAS